MAGGTRTSATVYELSTGRAMTYATNSAVTLLIDPDGPVGRYIALDDLDATAIRLLRQFLTPRIGSDGREYFDTYELCREVRG